MAFRADHLCELGRHTMLEPGNAFLTPTPLLWPTTKTKSRLELQSMAGGRHEKLKITRDHLAAGLKIDNTGWTLKEATPCQASDL